MRKPQILNCEAMSTMMTYEEQIEDLRPECGFTILSDGTVVRGRNPDSYNEELVQYWQKRWRVMKELGYFNRDEKELKGDKDQLPITTVKEDSKNAQESTKDVEGGKNEKPVHKKRSNHKKNKKNHKK